MRSILFTIDCWRSDRLYYKQEVTNTPNITCLAQDGVVFEKAVSAADSTDPSHASIMTSCYPPVHGLTRNGLRLSNHIPVLAEVLRENGCETMGAIGVEHLSSHFGFNRGFKTYYNNSRLDFIYYSSMRLGLFGIPLSVLFDRVRRYIPRLSTHCRSAEATNRKVLPWLEQNCVGDFFVWVHYFDAHSYKRKEDYDKSIQGIDTQLGRIIGLLERRKLLDDTLIILTGDHGQLLGEHGLRGHGSSSCLDGEILVPLVFCCRKQFSHKILTNQVRTIDIAPTILEIYGLPKPGIWQGQSLVPFIGGKRESQDLPALSYSSYIPPLTRAHASTKHWELNAKSLRTGRHKLVRTKNEKDKLFDLRADPLETSNIVDTQVDELQEMKALFFDLEGLGSGVPQNTEENAAVLNMLKALGYVD